MARTIRVGGERKSELLCQLQLAGVRLNEAAQGLFADDRFTTSAFSSVIEIAELSVASLGLHNGVSGRRTRLENADGVGDDGVHQGFKWTPWNTPSAVGGATMTS